MAEKSGKGGRRTRKRSLARRLALAVVAGFLVIAVLPVLLVPLYAVVPPPASTLEIWQRLKGVTIKKQWVPLDDIAPVLVHSVIMSEDGQFCAHRGVDWAAVRHVLDRGDSRGASTIPMQTVKNLFLWQSRSYVRKGLEIPLAYWADMVWSKRRMMEIYLNIVEWGPGVFGAEAAAQHWFGVPASKLSRRQAALMAAALPNPIVRNPAKPGRTTNYVAGIVERRARQAGAYIKCVE